MPAAAGYRAGIPPAPFRAAPSSGCGYGTSTCRARLNTPASLRALSISASTAASPESVTERAPLTAAIEMACGWRSTRRAASCAGNPRRQHRSLSGHALLQAAAVEGDRDGILAATGRRRCRTPPFRPRYGRKPPPVRRPTIATAPPARPAARKSPAARSGSAGAASSSRRRSACPATTSRRAGQTDRSPPRWLGDRPALAASSSRPIAHHCWPMPEQTKTGRRRLAGRCGRSSSWRALLPAETPRAARPARRCHGRRAPAGTRDGIASRLPKSRCRASARRSGHRSLPSAFR